MSVWGNVILLCLTATGSNESSESNSPTSHTGDLELVDMRANSTTAATVSSGGAYRYDPT